MVSWDRVGSTSGARRGPSDAGLLFRLPFMRPPMDSGVRQPVDVQGMTSPPPAVTSSPTAAVTQQHKTRRRRGSLRKAALLGRGVQQEKKDSKPTHLTQLTQLSTSHAATSESEPAVLAPSSVPERNALGLKLIDFPPVAPPGGVGSSSSHSKAAASNHNHSIANGMAYGPQAEPQDGLRRSYNSTTDEDEVLHMPHGLRPASPTMSVSSGSEGYFAERTVASSRRSFQQAKSPLSYSGISTTPLPPPNSNWDYSETEWWGWVVLTATWFVFVIGMGSCFNIWSWAWDVGKTPYAPPELEDDPTLPIVGYYPALLILTGVMAWVWVVVAWVGMKYFRHAKISGD